MKIVADTPACVGAGMCANVAPSVFDIDADSGLVQVLAEGGDIPSGDTGAVSDAIALCPAQALRWEDSGAV
ncbi:ferredoxin [Streptomyces caniscabiei]|uniref:ferredoxin n=1 Tax=Streptomyces caniscabiei TaxID=2746961 RepID=UPI0029B29BDA|nr:ferredoxin [Streptomyces caniscabiei]MDX2600344.1 ferredoxin [Streptomyces caniscabiei]